MKASILTIGDEILNGFTVDTNATYIAENAVNSGIEITNMLSVSDTKTGIIDGLNYLSEKCDLIFVTGGLGPTKDDITVKTLAAFLKANLVFDEKSWHRINKMLSNRNGKLLEVDKERCFFPEGAILLKNKKGTAPCMWLQSENTTIVSMPGVPLEMKQILIDEVLPKIKTNFQLKKIINKYILVAGIWESKIAEKIIAIENNFPKEISLAYLPKLGQVTLRLTGYNTTEKQVDKYIDAISKKLGDYVFSFDSKDSLEKVIGKQLLAKKATLSTAESCTGGNIAQRITSIAGSSAYFEGSIVSYSNNLKRNQLKVAETTLKKFGAVSEQTITEMAEGALAVLKTDYSIAVSGIAGPSGGTAEKPVGTVWIAVANKNKTITKKFSFWPYRKENIELSTVAALNMLRKFLA